MCAGYLKVACIAAGTKDASPCGTGAAGRLQQDDIEIDLTASDGGGGSPPQVGLPLEMASACAGTMTPLQDARLDSCAACRVHA